LKRRIKGKAFSRSDFFYEEVFERYTCLHLELKELGARSPGKVAERILKEEGWSAADIRNAMQWHRKRPSEMTASQKMIDRRKRYQGQPSPRPCMSAKQRDKEIRRIRAAAKKAVENENSRQIWCALGKFWNAAEKRVQDTDPGPPAVRGRKR